MAGYLIGIDLGTSGVRCAVFTEDGARKAMAYRHHPIDSPEPGAAEQHPELWWKNTCEVISEALEAGGIDGADVAGISFSGQMHGTVLLNYGGSPIRPAILWADSRSAEQCRELEETLGKKRQAKLLMNRIFPGTQAATLAWIKACEPESWDKTQRILSPKDYIRFRMCGLYSAEPSDASATLLFDVGLRDWSEDMLSILGIPITWLPYVLNSDQHIGETRGIRDETGLPDGVPVIMGGGDQPCTAFGNGIVEEGSLLVTIGTGGQLFAPLATAKSSPELALNTFCHLPVNRWFIMGATLAAGLSLAWFRDEFASDISFGDLDNEASGVPAGADGLSFEPYLGGRRSPVLDPDATGTFTGITSFHTRGHFVRAIMEGVAKELGDNVSVMREMGLSFERAVFSGGASKSDLWASILADTFNMPIDILPEQERACFGAALLAGIGAGVYTDRTDAVSVVEKPDRTVEPSG